MKKLLLIAAVIIIAVNSSCQTITKGNFIGFHVYTVNLDPNVTWNQFYDFWMKKVTPEYEKNFECKAYALKGIRGECANCIAGMIVWKTEADRDKFFNKDGELNDVGKAAMAKMQPVLDQLAKLGTTTSKYTDWIIQ
jgi:hypothetical protein